MEAKIKTMLIISGIVTVVVIASLVSWYWSKNKQTPPEEAPSLGSEIFDKTQSPLEGQVPDTNPFKDQKNPLDVMYKNPFE